MKCRKCKAELSPESKYCNMCGAKVLADGQKPKSRGNGTGSVYKYGSGKWRAVITVGYIESADGVYRRQCRTKSGFKTKKEALEYLPILKQAPAQKPKSATFKELYEKWLPTHRAGKDTINCYKAAYRYFSQIHNTNIREIDIDDLQECLDDCPKGRRTKENMKALCGLVYKFAIPRHFVSLDLSKYLIVTGESGTKTALPSDALPKLWAHADSVFGAKYVIAHCYLGFRPAEFVSLKGESYMQKERAFIGGAKTDAGTNRTVTVSPKIQSIINELVSSAESGGHIIVDDIGKPLSAARYRDLFYSVLDKCGIENPVAIKDGKKCYTYTPHSCRHTFATLLKRVEGADKDKLELIGHTSDEMLRYYQDVDLDDLRKITDLI